MKKKGYVKLELLIEVNAEEQFLAENFVLEDMVDDMIIPNLHKDLKIEERSIDALSWDEWEDWKDMYF